MGGTIESKNKALVLEAFDTLFNKRNYVAAERFWSPAYIQHSAHIAPGRDGRVELVARGIEVSAVFHTATPGAQFQADGGGRADGLAPDHASYHSFATFRDPDGNGWLLQEVTTRLPGRGTSNLDVTTLAELLRETEKYHGEYEPTAPKHHWSGWYAAYIVARQNGKTPEEAANDGKLQIEGTH